MNFIEAAEQILRAAGKPLHYKKITEIALQQNLLSHVGKTPEITMSSRLAMIVKKDRGDAPIVKVKPGVFGLREFPAPVIQAAMGESGSEYEYEAKNVAASLRSRDRGAERAPSAGDAQEDTDVSTEGTPTGNEKKLPGADVFPAEADDDEPILANLDEESGSGGDSDSEGSGRRRRGRRRRGRKGGERDGRDGGGRDGGREGGRDRERDRDREARAGGDGRQGGGRPEFRAHRQPQPQGPGVRRVAPRQDIGGDWSRESDEGEGLGPALADAVYDALDRLGEGATYVRIAELLTRKGRLAGDPAALAPTVAAAARSDSARREATGLRPRFYAVSGHLLLTDWALPKDSVFAERDAQRFAERQRKNTRRAFIREIEKLPPVGLIELIASWLNSEGVSALRAVRRPGSNGAEFALAGKHQRGPEERSLAIVFLRDASDITPDRVIEVRGALHHFDNASAAWLITTGWVTPEARAEAQAQGAIPVTVFDGAALARAMERARIGLVTYAIPTLGIDFSLLELLGADALNSRDRMRRNEGGAEPRAEGEGEGDQAAPGGGDEQGEGRFGRRRRRGRGRGRGGESEEVSFDSLAPGAGEQGEVEARDGDSRDGEQSGVDDERASTDALDDEGDDFDREDALDEDASLSDPPADEFDADEEESTADPDDAEGSEDTDDFDREND